MKITLKEIFGFISLSHNLKTIKKQDERGLLYRMNYKGDYYKLLPLIKNITKTGCTVFAHKNEKGEMLLGRNFDLRHFYTNKETGEKGITGLITVFDTNNKKAKYKSLCIADAIYLDPSCKIFHEGSFDNKKDFNRIRALLLPFLSMDGVNEKGLSVSVLHLSLLNIFKEIEYKDISEFTDKEKETMVILNNSGEKPDKSDARLNRNQIIINTADKLAWIVEKEPSTHQNDPEKENVICTVLMRYFLDYCETCDEAIELAKKYNLISEPNSDNHIVVTDRNKSIVMEWINNELTVKECYHASNFYNNREDHYGYGYNRDEVFKKAIKDNPNGISEEKCMKALEDASQNCLANKDHGFTQWSAVYNLEKLTLDVSVHSDYKKIYHYNLNK